jgi:hypothetical protein
VHGVLTRGGREVSERICRMNRCGGKQLRLDVVDKALDILVRSRGLGGRSFGRNAGTIPGTS